MSIRRNDIIDVGLYKYDPSEPGLSKTEIVKRALKNEAVARCAIYNLVVVYRPPTGKNNFQSTVYICKNCFDNYDKETL
jgi:hypothetical protein